MIGINFLSLIFHLLEQWCLVQSSHSISIP